MSTAGGSPARLTVAEPTADLPARIYLAARETQDAAGSVALDQIRAQFCRDHSATDVDLAIHALVSLRRAAIDDSRMRLT